MTQSIWRICCQGEFYWLITRVHLSQYALKMGSKKILQSTFWRETMNYHKYEILHKIPLRPDIMKFGKSDVVIVIPEAHMLKISSRVCLRPQIRLQKSFILTITTHPMQKFYQQHLPLEQLQQENKRFLSSTSTMSIEDVNDYPFCISVIHTSIQPTSLPRRSATH